MKRCKVHYAFTVLHDLCIGVPKKPHVTILDPKINLLYNVCGATITLHMPMLQQ